MKKQGKKSTLQGAEMILTRNLFYRDQYHRVKAAVFFLMMINCALLVGLGYKITHPPEAQYFATSSAGNIIDVYELSNPVLSDDQVLQWTADNVRAAFSQDYMHYRQQLQSVSDSFTPNGWEDFLKALKDSNNLKSLVAMKMVSDVTITKPPQVSQKMVVGGHYAWKISMSILIKYSGDRNISMPMDVTVVVLREPVENYPQRIAINNFLPVPIKAG